MCFFQRVAMKIWRWLLSISPTNIRSTEGKFHLLPYKQAMVFFPVKRHEDNLLLRISYDVYTCTCLQSYNSLFTNIFQTFENHWGFYICDTRNEVCAGWLSRDNQGKKERGEPRTYVFQNSFTVVCDEFVSFFLEMVWLVAKKPTWSQKLDINWH